MNPDLQKRGVDNSTTVLAEPRSLIELLPGPCCALPTHRFVDPKAWRPDRKKDVGPRDREQCKDEQTERHAIGLGDTAKG